MRVAAFAAFLGLLCPFARAEQAAAPPASGLDLEVVQGLLAMQRIDGWLLTDYRGQNAIARDLVRPAGVVTRRWFYFVPQRGEPVAVVPAMEAQSFDGVPGKKIPYAGLREMDTVLGTLLARRRRIAMEYSPRAELPALSRVDAGLVERIRALGPKVVSSADLVQAVKARWGPEGRATHYVAVHHLVKLRQGAFRFIAERVQAETPVTERDVVEHVMAGMKRRGLEGGVLVAAGANAANPHYFPTPERSTPIRKGDLVLIDIWGRVADDPDAIYADMTWMAYVGDRVPEKYAAVFAHVANARDATVAFLDERLKARRPVKGYEGDRVARGVLRAAGYDQAFLHRTGHSIDTRVHGDGANIDDFESHETRTLLPGTGFSIEPGIYLAGELGVRSEIDCYVGAGGLEVTTPVQRKITPLLAPELE